jgi:hypothetical protein
VQLRVAVLDVRDVTCERTDGHSELNRGKNPIITLLNHANFYLKCQQIAGPITFQLIDLMSLAKYIQGISTAVRTTFLNLFLFRGTLTVKFPTPLLHLQSICQTC